MKEKFDFTAEMNESALQHPLNNEFLEEEKRLLDVNAKELAKLNDSLLQLRTDIENLSGSLRECKPIITNDMHKLAVDFGATLLCNFVSQIESKCKEAERRIKKSANFIPIPATAFYITIIILVALSSFFVCIIVANAEILHSAIIWKTVTGCSALAILGIAITIFLPKVLK